METTVKQRLIAFINYLGTSKNAFEKECGLSIRAISNCGKTPNSDTIKKILLTHPELNPEWLLTGEGEMLKPSATTNSGDITITDVRNSHISNVGHGGNYGGTSLNTPTRSEDCSGEASADIQELLQGAPVIPTALCREGGCDILEYIEENPEEVEISPIRAKGVTIDLWYRIRATDNSNAPTYLPGDNIALASYPKGEERPRPGRFYVVDTYSNGFELGILFPTDSGDFRMQKKNREEFPDFTIERDDIIRIYRVIMMVRI